MLFFGVPYGTRTRTVSLEGWGAAITPMRHMGGTPGIKPEPAVPQTAVLSLHHGGVRGGTRTRKTCVLSAVPMPIRLHGHLVGVEGVEPSPRGPRPRILPLYDTPMMKQAVFLLSGGLYKTTCFNCGS